MADTTTMPPLAVEAATQPPRTRPPNDPEPFSSRMPGRGKRRHGRQDELAAVLGPDGGWTSTHKDGRPC
ncbi:MAG TPA: hypothetical protein PKA13_10945 [Geminicoccaceae bacterium]|nr:hypothetical protein [Geminicoccus sp.]HMU50282.1 hypothetical protein [Geminicoccaceae bacterium]